MSRRREASSVDFDEKESTKDIMPLLTHAELQQPEIPIGHGPRDLASS